MLRRGSFYSLNSVAQNVFDSSHTFVICLIAQVALKTRSHFATLTETERYRFGPKNAMKAIVKVD
jgi:hypothetical protein